MSFTVSHSSDIQRAVAQVRSEHSVVGYRNLLSYTNSLDVTVFTKTDINPETWVPGPSGSYSATYEALLTSRSGPKRVIVKQPKGSFSRDDVGIENDLQRKALSSIIQELRILAHRSLRSHPNLTHLLGVFFQEEFSPPGTRPCVILDRAAWSLSSYLHEHAESGIDGKTMILFASDIASGLSAIHAHGLLHGDLKPDNILLFPRDDGLAAALADFGTCGVAGDETESIVGTVGYYAPEYFTRSRYHSWANRQPRDIYGLGLLIFSIVTYHASPPFPRDSLALQHDDDACLRHLLSRVPRDSEFPVLLRLLGGTISADPAQRSTLAQIRALIGGAADVDVDYQRIQDFAVEKLLSNPANPRVDNLRNMELSDHLFSKLLSEYAVAADDTQDIRLAVTMAAMYSGALGHALEWPLSFIAKAQWLLKAVELGSLSAVQSIFADHRVLLLVEIAGRLLFSEARAGFKPPSVSLDALIHRLTEFASRPDVESLNLLVFLGGDIPSHIPVHDPANPSGPYRSRATNSVTQERLREAFPGLRDGDYLQDILSQDLQHLDSDALDLIIAEMDDAAGYAYSNELENLAKLPPSAIEPRAQKLLGVAVLGGSVEVVRYLLEEYNADPNAIVEDHDQASSDGSPATAQDEEMDLDTSEAEADASGSEADLDDTELPEIEAQQSSSTPGFLFFERMDAQISIFDTSIMFGQKAIALALLEHGAVVHPASGSNFSSLHLLARFDDAHLTRLLCQSAADNNNLEEVVHSRPQSGYSEQPSAIECIMYSGRWSTVATILEFGVDPNAGEDETSLLYMAVRPLCPAPRHILKALLDLGAHVDMPLAQQKPALFWAIGTSNVIATQLLLSYGASLSQPGGGSFVDFAAACVAQTASQGESVEVVDKTGRSLDSGRERVSNATVVIHKMTQVASERTLGWRGLLDQLLDDCSALCKGRTWVADDAASPTLLLETVF